LSNLGFGTGVDESKYTLVHNVRCYAIRRGEMEVRSSRLSGGYYTGNVWGLPAIDYE
jgi:hypothetical protein